MNSEYEVVVGLEVHAQLLTHSKLFAGDTLLFGEPANTQVSAITLALPGTLPKLNEKAIELAIRLGVAMGCSINANNYFARKHYFYPDLPKGYQVSQHTTPICEGGGMSVTSAIGDRYIQLNRIHMEEDAGKSLHDVYPDFTCIDLNRAGTPLVEIVTEPDLRSAEEAAEFLTKLRRLVRWLEVCDGNMEEGSMRCDANISVRKIGETKLGTKVEIKNLNSIKNVRKAIESEVKRLIQLIDAGGIVKQETRGYDPDRDRTFSQRTKEDAEDYRYFPEPDLSPFSLSGEFIENIKNSLPRLPEETAKHFIELYGLSEYDAGLICEDRLWSDYFEETVSIAKNGKAVANWLLGPVRSRLNDQGIDIDKFPLRPARLAQAIALVEEGQLAFSQAAQKLLPAMLEHPTENALQLAQSLHLLQDASSDDVNLWVEKVLQGMPDKVKEYHRGKKGLIGLFMGEVKKLSRGKADPQITSDLLLKKLDSMK